MSKDPNAPVPPEEGTQPSAQADAMSRRQFIIRLSAYGLTAAAASTALAHGVALAQDVPPGTEPPLGGTLEATAEIDAGEGASSYHLVGTIVYETYENPRLPAGDWGMRILRFSLNGKRLSGPDLGPVTLELAGNTDGVTSLDGSYTVSGPLTYADRAHGRLQAEARWSGVMDEETDELKSLRVEGVAHDAKGTMAVPVIGVGVAIPIGKLTDDDMEEM